MVASYASIASKADLLAADAVRDIALCGRSLGKADPVHPDLASAGAHEPTPTPYFVLEELLGKLGLTANDHLLDVGCGTGRVLAYAASQLPCRATGVELDSRLANVASSWAASSPQLNVIAGSVLDISLAPYTCFYLFNPFDTAVLTRFLDKAEREAALREAQIERDKAMRERQMALREARIEREAAMREAGAERRKDLDVALRKQRKVLQKTAAKQKRALRKAERARQRAWER